MNKRVIHHYKGDLSRISFNPARREALMAQYADYAASVRQQQGAPAGQRAAA
jgi:alkane 1-monooxygenase